MANLLVRNLDDGLVRCLKRRAEANKRSVQAEHRAILEAALQPVITGDELVRRLRGEGLEPLPDDFESSITQSITEPADIE
jgi:plasmid stability protein